MFDQHQSRVPTSEDISLALRHCWQPVARIEDLERGPQRAVLLGEALAVFLTESGEPAVVTDRCAHRGASLSMGKVAGESIQCPYHGWEWAGKDGASTRAWSGRSWRSPWASRPSCRGSTPTPGRGGTARRMSYRSDWG